jgi:hypothetical protein
MPPRILIFETETEHDKQSGEKIKWSKQYYLPHNIGVSVLILVPALLLAVIAFLAIAW